jgi:hypothetical protein
MQDRSVAPDGIVLLQPYAQLDSGIWLEFIYTEDWPEPTPIVAAEVNADRLTPIKFVCDRIGETVEEVVICTQWGSYGLLLDSGWFLHLTIVGDVVQLGMSVPWEIDEQSEYIPYWGRVPLPQWESFGCNLRIALSGGV